MIRSGPWGSLATATADARARSTRTPDTDYFGPARKRWPPGVLLSMPSRLLEILVDVIAGEVNSLRRCDTVWEDISMTRSCTKDVDSR